MTRFRAAILSGLAFGLGGVATGGLRLMDSPSALLGVVGSATVLAVALAFDALRTARDVAAARKELAELREAFTKQREHLSAVEGLVATTKITGDVLLRRSGSSPDLGDVGRADRTGPNRGL